MEAGGWRESLVFHVLGSVCASCSVLGLGDWDSSVCAMLSCVCVGNGAVFLLNCLPIGVEGVEWPSRPTQAQAFSLLEEVCGA